MSSTSSGGSSTLDHFNVSLIIPIIACGVVILCASGGVLFNWFQFKNLHFPGITIVQMLATIVFVGFCLATLVTPHVFQANQSTFNSTIEMVPFFRAMTIILLCLVLLIALLHTLRILNLFYLIEARAAARYQLATNAWKDAQSAENLDDLDQGGDNQDHNSTTIVILPSQGGEDDQRDISIAPESLLPMQRDYFHCYFDANGHDDDDDDETGDIDVTNAPPHVFLDEFNNPSLKQSSHHHYSLTRRTSHPHDVSDDTEHNHNENHFDNQPIFTLQDGVGSPHPSTLLQRTPSSQSDPGNAVPAPAPPTADQAASQTLILPSEPLIGSSSSLTFQQSLSPQLRHSNTLDNDTSNPEGGLFLQRSPTHISSSGSTIYLSFVSSQQPPQTRTTFVSLESSSGATAVEATSSTLYSPRASILLTARSLSYLANHPSAESLHVAQHTTAPRHVPQSHHSTTPPPPAAAVTTATTNPNHVSSIPVPLPLSRLQAHLPSPRLAAALSPPVASPSAPLAPISSPSSRHSMSRSLSHHSHLAPLPSTRGGRANAGTPSSPSRRSSSTNPPSPHHHPQHHLSLLPPSSLSLLNLPSPSHSRSLAGLPASSSFSSLSPTPHMAPILLLPPQDIVLNHEKTTTPKIAGASSPSSRSHRLPLKSDSTVQQPPQNCSSPHSHRTIPSPASTSSPPNSPQQVSSKHSSQLALEAAEKQDIFPPMSPSGNIAAPLPPRMTAAHMTRPRAFFPTMLSPSNSSSYNTSNELATNDELYRVDSTNNVTYRHHTPPFPGDSREQASANTVIPVHRPPIPRTVSHAHMSSRYQAVKLPTQSPSLNSAQNALLSPVSSADPRVEPLRPPIDRQSHFHLGSRTLRPNAFPATTTHRQLGGYATLRASAVRPRDLSSEEMPIATLRPHDEPLRGGGSGSTPIFSPVGAAAAAAASGLPPSFPLPTSFQPSRRRSSAFSTLQPQRAKPHEATTTGGPYFAPEIRAMYANDADAAIASIAAAAAGLSAVPPPVQHQQPSPDDVVDAHKPHQREGRSRTLRRGSLFPSRIRDQPQDGEFPRDHSVAHSRSATLRRGIKNLLRRGESPSGSPLPPNNIREFAPMPQPVVDIVSEHSREDDIGLEDGNSSSAHSRYRFRPAVSLLPPTPTSRRSNDSYLAIPIFPTGDGLYTADTISIGPDSVGQTAMPTRKPAFIDAALSHLHSPRLGGAAIEKHHQQQQQPPPPPPPHNIPTLHSMQDSIPQLSVSLENYPPNRSAQPVLLVPPSVPRPQQHKGPLTDPRTCFVLDEMFTDEIVTPDLFLLYQQFQQAAFVNQTFQTDLFRDIDGASDLPPDILNLFQQSAFDPQFGSSLHPNNNNSIPFQHSHFPPMGSTSTTTSPVLTTPLKYPSTANTNDPPRPGAATPLVQSTGAPVPAVAPAATATTTTTNNQTFAAQFVHLSFSSCIHPQKHCRFDRMNEYLYEMQIIRSPRSSPRVSFVQQQNSFVDSNQDELGDDYDHDDNHHDDDDDDGHHDDGNDNSIINIHHNIDHRNLHSSDPVSPFRPSHGHNHRSFHSPGGPSANPINKQPSTFQQNDPFTNWMLQRPWFFSPTAFVFATFLLWGILCIGIILACTLLPPVYLLYVWFATFITLLCVYTGQLALLMLIKYRTVLAQYEHLRQEQSATLFSDDDDDHAALDMRDPHYSGQLTATSITSPNMTESPQASAGGRSSRLSIQYTSPHLLGGGVQRSAGIGTESSITTDYPTLTSSLPFDLGSPLGSPPGIATHFSDRTSFIFAPEYQAYMTSNHGVGQVGSPNIPTLTTNTFSPGITRASFISGPDDSRHTFMLSPSPPGPPLGQAGGMQHASLGRFSTVLSQPNMNFNARVDIGLHPSTTTTTDRHINTNHHNHTIDDTDAQSSGITTVSQSDHVTPKLKPLRSPSLSREQQHFSGQPRSQHEQHLDQIHTPPPTATTAATAAALAQLDQQFNMQTFNALLSITQQQLQQSLYNTTAAATISFVDFESISFLTMINIFAFSSGGGFAHVIFRFALVSCISIFALCIAFGFALIGFIFHLTHHIEQYWVTPTMTSSGWPKWMLLTILCSEIISIYVIALHPLAVSITNRMKAAFKRFNAPPQPSVQHHVEKHVLLLSHMRHPLAFPLIKALAERTHWEENVLFYEAILVLWSNFWINFLSPSSARAQRQFIWGTFFEGPNSVYQINVSGPQFQKIKTTILALNAYDPMTEPHRAEQFEISQSLKLHHELGSFYHDVDVYDQSFVIRDYVYEYYEHPKRVKDIARLAILVFLDSISTDFHSLLLHQRSIVDRHIPPPYDLDDIWDIHASKTPKTSPTVPSGNVASAEPARTSVILQGTSKPTNQPTTSVTSKPNNNKSAPQTDAHTSTNNSSGTELFQSPIQHQKQDTPRSKDSILLPHSKHKPPLHRGTAASITATTATLSSTQSNTNIIDTPQSSDEQSGFLTFSTEAGINHPTSLLQMAHFPEQSSAAIRGRTRSSTAFGPAELPGRHLHDHLNAPNIPALVTTHQQDQNKAALGGNLKCPLPLLETDDDDDDDDDGDDNNDINTPTTTSSSQRAFVSTPTAIITTRPGAPQIDELMFDPILTMRPGLMRRHSLIKPSSFRQIAILNNSIRTGGLPATSGGSFAGTHSQLKSGGESGTTASDFSMFQDEPPTKARDGIYGRLTLDQCSLQDDDEQAAAKPQLTTAFRPGTPVVGSMRDSSPDRLANDSGLAHRFRDSIVVPTLRLSSEMLNFRGGSSAELGQDTTDAAAAPPPPAAAAADPALNSPDRIFVFFTRVVKSLYGVDAPLAAHVLEHELLQFTCNLYSDLTSNIQGFIDVVQEECRKREQQHQEQQKQYFEDFARYLANVQQQHQQMQNQSQFELQSNQPQNSQTVYEQLKRKIAGQRRKSQPGLPQTLADRNLVSPVTASNPIQSHQIQNSPPAALFSQNGSSVQQSPPRGDFNFVPSPKIPHSGDHHQQQQQQQQQSHSLRSESATPLNQHLFSGPLPHMLSSALEEMPSSTSMAPSAYSTTSNGPNNLGSIGSRSAKPRPGIQPTLFAASSVSPAISTPRTPYDPLFHRVQHEHESTHQHTDQVSFPKQSLQPPFDANSATPLHFEPVTPLFHTSSVAVTPVIIPATPTSSSLQPQQQLQSSLPQPSTPRSPKSQLPQLTTSFSSPQHGSTQQEMLEPFSPRRSELNPALTPSGTTSSLAPIALHYNTASSGSSSHHLALPHSFGLQTSTPPQINHNHRLSATPITTPLPPPATLPSTLPLHSSLPTTPQISTTVAESQHDDGELDDPFPRNESNATVDSRQSHAHHRKKRIAQYRIPRHNSNLQSLLRTQDDDAGVDTDTAAVSSSIHSTPTIHEDPSSSRPPILPPLTSNFLESLPFLFPNSDHLDPPTNEQLNSNMDHPSVLRQFTPKHLSAENLTSFSWKVRALVRRLQAYYIYSVASTVSFDVALTEICLLVERDKNSSWLESNEYQDFLKLQQAYLDKQP